MALDFKPALAAGTMGLLLAGCYFTSEKNLIPPELRVDPFGETGYYLVPPDSDESGENPQYDEAMIRLPDGGFLGIKAHSGMETSSGSERYDFAPISSEDWPEVEDRPNPGAPHMMSICEIVLLDDVSGCLLFGVFVQEDGAIVTLSPGPAEGADDEALVFTDLDSVVEQLHIAWRDGHYETQVNAALIEVSRDELETAGFAAPVFSIR